MKKLILALFVGTMLGCGDTIVGPTPVTINTAIEASPIDGHWIAVLRDDIYYKYLASWHIGEDGKQRILSGNVLVTYKQIPGSVPQPFVVQFLGAGIIVHEDLSWQATVYTWATWDVRGRLIDANTMEVRIEGFPEGVKHTFKRATSWPKK